jgi:uncharacterized membrane protein YjgN (DUF898 family)
MNEMRDVGAAGTPPSAFEFAGSWREYLPIAVTNVLLTLVTLGFYRFWAKARERRYLWSRTRFIDDHLEWTGSGKEMFIGFFLAVLILGLVGLLLFGLFVVLSTNGLETIAILLSAGAYPASFYIVGLARFRALRYRLSRTLWHGIRGGSDDQGFRYGWTSAWMTLVGAFIFLLLPWSMITLWNERWSAMSFGPHQFSAAGESSPLLVRLLLSIGLGIGLIFVVGIAAIVPLHEFFAAANGGPPSSTAGILIVLLPLALLAIFAVVPIFFYAAFFREGINKLSLGAIDFGFSARTVHWLKLYAGDVLLVVGTLGLGIAFLGYRHWSFFIRHLEAYGEVNLDSLLQSETRAPRQGEGLFDALDLGAI